MSRSDNSFLVITPIPCQPATFVAETLALFRSEFSSKKIDHRLDVSSSFKTMEVDYIVTDPGRVSQLLINLVTNAISRSSLCSESCPAVEVAALTEFTATSDIRRVNVSLDITSSKPDFAECSPAAEIQLQSQTDPAVLPTSPSDTLFLICSVADTGCGLTADEKQGLFQRFHQV